MQRSGQRATRVGGGAGEAKLWARREAAGAAAGKEAEAAEVARATLEIDNTTSVLLRAKLVFAVLLFTMQFPMGKYRN